MMTIGQEAGTTTPTLRYYEQRGLIPPAQRISGQRRYTADVLVTLRVIRMAQEAGFSLDEIHTLLNGYGPETTPPERWQDLARRKILEVDVMIDRLRVVRQVLDESLACDCLTLDTCAEGGWTVHPSRVGMRIRPFRAVYPPALLPQVARKARCLVSGL